MLQNQDQVQYPKKKKSHVWLIFVIILLIILGIIAGLLLKKNKPDDIISRQLSLGERYYADLDYDQAIAAYNDVLEIDPKNEDALYGIAYSYEARGQMRLQNGSDYYDDFAAAKDYFEQAVSYYPNSDMAENAQEKIAKIEEIVSGAPQEEVAEEENTKVPEGSEDAYVLTYSETYNAPSSAEYINLTGRLVKADWSCPYADMVMSNEGDSQISYADLSSLSMENTGDYHIMCPWGLILDQPITLTVDGQSITVSEIGLNFIDCHSYPALQDGKQYFFRGHIRDLYESIHSFHLKYVLALGAPVEATEDHLRLGELYIYEQDVETKSYLLPFDYYFPFGHYALYITEMTEVQ